ncbi:hypothetical protein FQN54_005484 [Arachnomyces sp. PD_36]|nr:hypothetical protein FQN54_005484 [Arachnomyces sp. PD_36]
MVVELRKRKAPPPPPAPAKKTKTTKAKASAPAAKPKKEPVKKADAPAKTPAKSDVPAVGDKVELDGFGGEIETNDGDKTTLKALLEDSKSGVIVFTYPRASTPGCTTQVCLFRDNYDDFAAAGFAVYGLSTDSTKANTTFKTKQKLSYPLLCDPSATLIGAIGLKKVPKGTTRGVFAIDKDGEVLLSQPGGPDATLKAAQKLIPNDEKEGEEKYLTKDRETPKNPIVLAHGLMGFDELRLAGKYLPGVQYWRGIKDALAMKGIEVFTATVPASGSIEERGEALMSEIKDAAAGRKVNIIAHSMGYDNNAP